MAHCDPDVREIWTEELIAAGVMGKKKDLGSSDTGQETEDSDAD